MILTTKTPNCLTCWKIKRWHPMILTLTGKAYMSDTLLTGMATTSHSSVQNPDKRQEAKEFPKHHDFPETDPTFSVNSLDAPGTIHPRLASVDTLHRHRLTSSSALGRDQIEEDVPHHQRWERKSRGQICCYHLAVEGADRGQRLSAAVTRPSFSLVLASITILDRL